MTQHKKLKKQPQIVTQVDDFGRKKFALKQVNEDDVEDEQIQQKFIDTGSKYTSTLIGRQQKIDTDKYLGKIQSVKKRKKTEVFYCQVCKLGFKCDLAYITHINSPSHNRKLGMNMRVEAVSIGSVIGKLNKLAQEKNKSKKEKILEKKFGKNWQAQLRRRQREQNQPKQQILRQNSQDQEKNSQKQYQGPQIKIEDEKIKLQKPEQQQPQQQQDLDQDMMRQLGLPTSFGTKKKKY